MGNKLKSCQFCGNSDIRIERSERTVTRDSETQSRLISQSVRYKCFCAVCSIGTGMMFSEQAARDAWNRRPDDGET